MDNTFKSREGLVENLRLHLSKGKWAYMTGGPMIGKSHLLADLTESIKTQKDSTPPFRALTLKVPPLEDAALFWPALMETLLLQGIGPDTNNPYRKGPTSLSKLMSQLHHIYEKVSKEVQERKLILLIDNADHLLPHAEILIPQIVNMIMESLAPNIEAVCWVGGLKWMDWVEDNKRQFIFPMRHYPLSVVPIREARKIIEKQLGASEGPRVWHETGGHPMLMAQAFDPTQSFPVEELKTRLSEALGPEEKKILLQLDSEGEWKNLVDLKTNDASSLKPILDRLCMMGVVVRTLDGGTAVLRSTSRDLNTACE